MNWRKVGETNDVDTRAFKILLSRRNPISISELGWELWGATTPAPGRGEGSHGRNKFCRAAGKVLRRLEKEGKAVAIPEINRTAWTVAPRHEEKQK